MKAGWDVGAMSPADVVFGSGAAQEICEGSCGAGRLIEPCSIPGCPPGNMAVN